ncbi:MAG: sensor histidine kinase [Leptolyngbyaceae cyanobacterium]
MSYAIHAHRHPFPFLLYGEWVIIGIAILSELATGLLPRSNSFPVLTFGIIVAFGALGLWLPVKPWGPKLGHVVLQFGLLALAAKFGTFGLRLFPLLYIVLVLRSCLMFGLWGRLVVTGTVFVLFAGRVQIRVRSLDRGLPDVVGRRLFLLFFSLRFNLIVMFLLLLVFLLVLMNALLSERERREELRQAHQKLQASAAQIEKLAMDQERTRIAREIHDSLGHALTGLNIQLEGALKFWDSDPQQAQAFVAQAKEMGSIALQETRQAVASFRHAPSSDQDLADMVTPLTEKFQQITGIAPDVQINCPPLPASLKLTIYRIVQEALTNIWKYAQADQVAIAILAAQADRAGLEIRIQDNGVGFDPKDNTTGFGLRGIQERAIADGGQLRLTTAPGQGCLVQVWLPLTLEGT